MRWPCYRQKEWYRKAFLPCLFLVEETGLFLSPQNIQFILSKKEKKNMDATKYAAGYYPAPGAHYKWVQRDHIEQAPA